MAPAGGFPVRAKVRFWAGSSGSVADTVSVTVWFSAAVLLPGSVRTGGRLNIPPRLVCIRCPNTALSSPSSVVAVQRIIALSSFNAIDGAVREASELHQADVTPSAVPDGSKCWTRISLRLGSDEDGASQTTAKSPKVLIATEAWRPSPTTISLPTRVPSAS